MQHTPSLPAPRTCSDLRMMCVPDNTGHELLIRHRTTGESRFIDRHESIEDLEWHVPVWADGRDAAFDTVDDPSEWEVEFYEVKPDGTRSEPMIDPRVFIEDK